MRTPVSFLVPILASSLAGPAPAQALPETSPRVYRCEMSVRLEPATRTLHGSQLLTWRNTTRSYARELRWHMYMNAFRDLRSTHMREAGAEFRRKWRPNEFGWIELDHVERIDGERPIDLTAAKRYESPDDGNPDDATVLVLPLSKPIPPGGEIRLRTKFRTKLPKAYRRTGWIPDDGFFCMHWFPKLGVFEDREGGAVWNCHQFHANTEFFADFGVYRVEISAPEGYVVGATGGEPIETRREGGRSVLVFEQADVHDFAWVADPDFRRHTEQFGPLEAASDPVCVEVAKELGVPVENFDLPATKMILLLRPEHDTDEQRRRHFEALRCGLRFFGLRYGRYPYPAITAVDPGYDVLGNRLGGGMEYPTLITCGTSLFPHRRRLQPEGVTVHEFGHQYWYGLSANDEFLESWLDEGMNTYSEGRAQALYLASRVRPVRTTTFGLLTLAATPGPLADDEGIARWSRLPLWRVRGPLGARLRGLGLRGTWLPDSPLLDLLRGQPTLTYYREVLVSESESDRQRMLAVDNPDPMVRPGWLYLNRDSYRANSYQRPATILRTLERMVGRKRWWTFLAKFHARARFRHPTTADFTELLERECGGTAAAFFDRATRAGAVLDYGIERVSPADGKGPRKTVVIRRHGTITADVRVRLRFAGLAEPVVRTIQAADASPWWRLTFEDDRRRRYGDLLEVWVDPPGPSPTGEPMEAASGPAGALLLDANLLDNAWRARPDHGPALYRGIRLLLQTQSQLSFAGWIG